MPFIAKADKKRAPSHSNQLTRKCEKQENNFFYICIKWAASSALYNLSIYVSCWTEMRNANIVICLSLSFLVSRFSHFHFTMIKLYIDVNPKETKKHLALVFYCVYKHRYDVLNVKSIVNNRFASFGEYICSQNWLSASFRLVCSVFVFFYFDVKIEFNLKHFDQISTSHFCLSVFFHCCFVSIF